MTEAVYRAIGALPIEGRSEDPELLTPWLGTVMNTLLGVLTDPPAGELMEGDWLPEYDRIHRIASIQKAMIADGLSKITGLPAVAVLLVEGELRGAPFEVTSVVVDGESVSAQTLSYRGLDFVQGSDVRRHPFTMFRIAGSNAPWPALTSPDAATSAGTTPEPGGSSEPTTRAEPAAAKPAAPAEPAARAQPPAPIEPTASAEPVVPVEPAARAEPADAPAQQQSAPAEPAGVA